MIRLGKVGVVALAAAGLASGCAPAKRAHIVDRIENADRYVALNSSFKEAFEFLKRPDLDKLAVGRYDLVPGKCWAMVQEADLIPLAERKLESHRKYIDIQAPISGAEVFGLFEMGEKERALPFDEEKDIMFFEAEKRPVTLKPGEFAIFFPPNGAHAPCCAADKPGKTRKLVIKVLAD